MFISLFFKIFNSRLFRIFNLFLNKKVRNLAKQQKIISEIFLKINDDAINDNAIKNIIIGPINVDFF